MALHCANDEQASTRSAEALAKADVRFLHQFRR